MATKKTAKKTQRKPAAAAKAAPTAAAFPTTGQPAAGLGASSTPAMGTPWAGAGGWMPQAPAMPAGWMSPPWSANPYAAAQAALPTAMGGAAEQAAPISQGIGSALRLAVDLINASLAGGTRLLAGTAYPSPYGYGGGAHAHGCCHDGCGGCGSSCCCEYVDCCSVCGSGCGCCTPSVGNCC